LQSNKIPEDSGFDIVVNAFVEQEPDVPISDGPIAFDDAAGDEGDFIKGKMPIGKITARQISGLKTKDNPKAIISEIQSIHKLRRALTMTKDRAGKETLTRYIRDRISELQFVGLHD
jgi:hypothetical protein